MRRAFESVVEGSRVVEAAPEAVWAVLADFHRVDRWAPLVTQVRAIGEVTEGIGMARHCELRWLGGVDEVVNVWEPDRRIGYRVTPLGPVGESQSLWELGPEPDGSTRVRLRLSYEMRFGLAGRALDTLLARRTLTRNLRGALALLRRYLVDPDSMSAGR